RAAAARHRVADPIGLALVRVAGLADRHPGREPGPERVRARLPPCRICTPGAVRPAPGATTFDLSRIAGEHRRPPPRSSHTIARRVAVEAPRGGAPIVRTDEGVVRVDERKSLPRPNGSTVPSPKR